MVSNLQRPGATKTWPQPVRLNQTPKVRVEIPFRIRRNLTEPSLDKYRLCIRSYYFQMKVSQLYFQPWLVDS